MLSYESLADTQNQNRFLLVAHLHTQWFLWGAHLETWLTDISLAPASFPERPSLPPPTTQHLVKGQDTNPGPGKTKEIFKRKELSDVPFAKVIIDENVPRARAGCS